MPEGRGGGSSRRGGDGRRVRAGSLGRRGGDGRRVGAGSLGRRGRGRVEGRGEGLAPPGAGTGGAPGRGLTAAEGEMGHRGGYTAPFGLNVLVISPLRRRAWPARWPAARLVSRTRG